MIAAKNYFKILQVLYVKELKETFGNSAVYILAGLFCFLIGGLFYNYVALSPSLHSGNLNSNVLVPLFGNMNFIFLFIAPLLTMRMFVEERRNGTFDLLTLAHVTNYQILLSKLAASATITLLMLVPTLIFPAILAISGYHDFGVVGACYLGTFLSVLCYLSVGLFSACAVDNQVVAAILGFAILLSSMLIVILGQLSQNYLVSQMISYLSVPFHYEGFVRGVVKTYNLVYFASFVTVFTYLSHQVLEGRRQ
ncbi:MAG: ABC transporter permease [Bdellovibrio sp.]|nr:ABC transporter permease [Bdellovibrio sp.]